MSSSVAFKRNRGQESSVEGSSHSSLSSPTTTKALRLTRAEAAPLFCSLPPTCNPPHNHPTALANVSELEAHYAKYHAHVCEEKGCAAVFPNARLLELHQTECHDPIALLRKERGEKIFACHLESCTRKFLDPKKRRLHLIQAHGYPKEYFFAVTNKGVGGLLKRWGEGASLIRGSWKARDRQGDMDKKQDMDVESGEDVDEDENGIDEEMSSTGTVKVKSAVAEPRLEETTKESRETSGVQPASATADLSQAAGTTHGELDDLTSTMSSLSLVPRNIRFGRGGKSARVTRETHDSAKEGKHARNPAHHSTAAGQNVVEAQTDADCAEQNDVSINIDGALEALKSEAPLNVSARNIMHTSKFSANHPPASGRRARGGRGRGRGPSRGHSRA